MRRSTIVLNVWLCTLSAATWLATSRLLAQKQEARHAPPGVETRKVGVAGGDKRIAPGVPVEPLASIVLKGIEAEAVEGGASIHAAAGISDRRRGGVSYVWHLIVAPAAGGERVVDTYYLDHAFQAPDGNPFVQRFAEGVPLVGGAYKIRLRLLELVPGTDPATLRNDSTLPSLSASANVVVR